MSSPPKETIPPIGGIAITQIAEAMNVSVRSIERASFVKRNGIPEIADAVRDGRLRLGPAEAVA